MMRTLLQQTRVQIEDITREGFPAGRPAQQQRHLTIGYGVLGEVIINAEGMPAGIPKVLSHRATGIRGYILQGS